jgi:hypothetical protein
VQNLGQLVDFEVMLTRDADLASRDGPAALQVRDEALSAQIEADAPRARLRAWTELRQKAEPSTAGHRIEQVVRALFWGTAVLGILVGGPAATALLAYDGQSPINVLAWLLYTALLPFGLAVALALGLLLPRRWMRKAGFAQALVGAVARPVLNRAMGGRWIQLFWDSTSTRHMEQALWVGLTQVFTLGFLLAALGVLAVKVATSDLAFSWSTTLDVSDRQAAALVRTVASPWATWWPGAVPGRVEIEASNYSRFVARYRGTEGRQEISARVAAAWWQFSMAAILTYGLAPRLLLAAWARRRWRKGLARWPDLERADVQALLDRLGSGGFRYREGRSDPLDLPSVEQTPAPAPALDPNEPLMAVVWGAASVEPTSVAESAGLRVSTAWGAGANLDLSAEERALREAASHSGPVMLLVPSDEPPVEDVLGFLRELSAVAPRVRVGLLDRNDGAWRMAPVTPSWRRALQKIRGVEVHSA